MDITQTIIIASIVSSLISVFVVLYSRRISLSEKMREEEKKYKALLDFKREKFEDQLYDIIDSQPMDNLVLTGSQELYVQATSSDISLSNSSIDMSFFHSMGLSPDTIEVEHRMACVIMPFHPKYEKVYTSIKNGCNKAEFTHHRTDEEYTIGNILRNIVTIILKSQVVIAVIDGNNPNVFYEVGIAHTIGKPVIFVANKNRMDNKKFDLDHNRIILYNNVQELEKELSKYLVNLGKHDGSR